jgi:pimeloyl-ACP methyl ester carboxylesterase
VTATIHSFSAAVEIARAALVTIGLARCNAGGTVYFAGGASPSANNPRPAVVLVHGVNDQAGTWLAAARILMRERVVIIPDLPGHGESEPQTGPLPLPLMVERLHAVIEKEGARRVVLVGNSMGAWISILYALQHPDRVAALVLESGGGMAIAPNVPLSASNREEAVKILRAVHGPDAVLAEGAPDALVELSMSESPLKRVLQGNVFPYFVDARLGEIKVPTTLVWGADDGVISRAYMEKLHAGIAGSRLIVIPGAAHIAHAQQPERFVASWRDQ